MDCTFPSGQTISVPFWVLCRVIGVNVANNSLWTHLFTYFKNNLIYFWLCKSLSLLGLSPVVASGGCSLVVAQGLLIAVVSLEQSMGSGRVGLGSCCTRAQELPFLKHRLWSTGSIAAAHGFSCSVACGNFPDQGLNLHLWHWQADSLQLSHQGSPSPFILNEIAIHLV